jgi:hypothetical protein
MPVPLLVGRLLEPLEKLVHPHYTLWRLYPVPPNKILYSSMLTIWPSAAPFKVANTVKVIEGEKDRTDPSPNIPLITVPACILPGIAQPSRFDSGVFGQLPVAWGQNPKSE